LLLATLALLGWLSFQTTQLVKEREALQAAYASQQQTVDNSAKLRASLDAIAADTQRLADSGNANAKILVDELRKRGITISTTPKTPVDASKP
jgi:type II secretory pathway pseudopilin PulG